VQSSYWSNDLVLYDHGSKVAHQFNEVALTNLGTEFLRRGQANEALAISVNVGPAQPQWWQAQMNLGTALYALHRYAEAEEAVGIAARLPMAEASGGITDARMIRMKAGRTAEAEPALRAAADAVHARPSETITTRG